MEKNPPRETDTTPQNLGNVRQINEYTNDDGGRCDKSERGREGKKPSQLKVNGMKNCSYGRCRMNL